MVRIRTICNFAADQFCTLAVSFEHTGGTFNFANTEQSHMKSEVYV